MSVNVLWSWWTLPLVVPCCPFTAHTIGALATTCSRSRRRWLSALTRSRVAATFSRVSTKPAHCETLSRRCPTGRPVDRTMSWAFSTLNCAKKLLTPGQWQCLYGKSSLGSFDECRLSAKRPPTLRPNSQLIWAVSPLLPYSQHPLSPFIYYYYLAPRLVLILPSHRV